MAREKDYYEILGVARDASQDEIRRAYLKLAHKYHPDKTGGDKEAESKLKSINEAYDTLKNKERRARYDAFGTAQPGAGFGQGFGEGGFGFGGSEGFDSPFDDFFDVLFGRGGGARGRTRGRGARPGNDMEYRVRITLREAAAGAKRTIRFQRLEQCPDCSGTGAAAGSQPSTCPDCHGAGQVRRTQGFFSVSTTCPRCRGRGRVVGDPCRRCDGQGRVNRERELEIELPAGMDTGQRLRIPGEGEAGEPGAPRGDLYILVEIEEDNLFQRDGNDIVCQIPISFPQAALGDTIRVPTLKGEAELKIPAGTQSGKLFRMKGFGVPDVQGYHTGDQLVRVQVETPTKLSREQRELLERFQELSSEQSYPLYKRFMDKLRESLGG
jgi:molecular chaperone DnaJ